jgi:hypothetical protein
MSHSPPPPHHPNAATSSSSSLWGPLPAPSKFPTAPDTDPPAPGNVKKLELLLREPRLPAHRTAILSRPASQTALRPSATAPRYWHRKWSRRSLHAHFSRTMGLLDSLFQVLPSPDGHLFCRPTSSASSKYLSHPRRHLCKSTSSSKRSKPRRNGAQPCLFCPTDFNSSHKPLRKANLGAIASIQPLLPPKAPQAQVQTSLTTTLSPLDSVAVLHTRSISTNTDHPFRSFPRQTAILPSFMRYTTDIVPG